MKKIIEKILKLLSTIYLNKYKPEIIAITGSVGKTTTRKAVTCVLEGSYSIRPFEENSYNTEIGLPLSIFGQKVPDYKIFWLWVLLRCILEIIFSKRYDFLILEMGADKPGDISYFLDFVKPKISIFTRVTAAHIDSFKTIENIIKEKSKVIKILKEEDLAILNGDDSLILPFAKEAKSKILTYGLSLNNDIYASDIKFSDKGISCILNIKGKDYEFSPQIFGEHLLYSLLAAVCVGVNYKISDEEIIRLLNEFKPVRGRMNVIHGIRDTVLIDDSYNANPVSTIKALEALKKIAKKRKIAVIGTMNELGSYYESGHKEVGEKTKDFADILVTVGDGGKIIADEAIKNDFLKEHIYIRGTSDEAGDVLKGIIEKGDTILFKGSQNKVMLERAIVKVMKNPRAASSTLVRQSRAWLRK